MPENLAQLWGSGVELAICEGCDWRYLLAKVGDGPGRLSHCPHCYQAVLTELDGELEPLPSDQPPELVLPFAVSEADIKTRIQAFAADIPSAPTDLNPATLLLRLQKLYLPRWLVDSRVQALWQADLGFNYQVVSHQDHFDQNQNEWASQEVRETRIRWEPRVGRLRRSYQNISAPAIEDEAEIRQRLGDYDLQPARPYQADDLGDAMVRLPNRLPDDAWGEAESAFLAEAAQECRRAAAGDHIRQFRWSAQFEGRNWTQLLLPVYTTYYLDDDRQPQFVLLHGQSGRINGLRRASMKRAKRTALKIATVAGAIFLFSGLIALLGFWEDEFFTAAGIGILLSTLVGLGALAPIVIAWSFNWGQAEG